METRKVHLLTASVCRSLIAASLFLVGCGGGSTAGLNNSSGNGAANGAKGSDAKASEYPMLASGFANAEFELLDGTKSKVVDRKGKVLLVNIWGIWCGPCRAEMPHLVELQDMYRDKGLEVIGLNIGDSNGAPEAIPAIEQFAKGMKLNYTLARSPHPATGEFYRVTRKQVVPQTLLIDSGGHLRGVFIGGGANVFSSMKETVAKVIAEGA